jgi:hypothetical protein
MNARWIAVPALSVVLLLSSAVSPVRAGTLGGASLFTPRVPVSAFGFARDWFDPARLHVATTVAVGSSWGSSGTNALQTTTLSYSFRAPVAMSVSLGNAWGGGASRNSSSFYLQGFQVAYQPNPSMFFRVEFQDLRSPLQYGYYDRFGAPGRWAY